MSIVLYDLCGEGDVRFSPYCWRTKMALAHKGLAFETRPTPFTAIPTIADGTQKTVPVIEDKGRIVRDSFDIAVYLEETYPDRPSLFGGPGGQGAARFVENWCRVGIQSLLTGLIVADGYDAEILRMSPESKLPGARRKVLMQKFAFHAARRLQGLRDPGAVLDGWG